MPTAMIKEMEKQYRNEIVKVKAFFVTAKGSGPDQKTANKKLPFHKTAYYFWFFDRYCNRGSKHPPSCAPVDVYT